MKPKMRLKMSIDLVMTVLLLFQMANMLVGNTVHEWMGAVLFCMLGLMVSGVIMSRAVMSVHLGLHWGMIMGMARKITKNKEPSAIRTWALRLLAILISGFGVPCLLYITELQRLSAGK